MGRVPDAAGGAHGPHAAASHRLLTLRCSSSRYTQVMYNVDAWSAQLETRIANGSLLLNRPTNLGRPGGSQEEAFARALARLEADLKYHREIFVEPTSKVTLARSPLHHTPLLPLLTPHPTTRFPQVILARIERLALPNELAPRGIQLLTNCGGLLAVLLGCIDAMATACASQKLKPMRQAAAERVLKHAEKVRTIVKAMDGSECVRVADEQRAALEETVARVAPLAPTEADYDSDDYA